jgi:hypothetical protein
VALKCYDIINHYKPGGLVESASSVPLSLEEVSAHKKEVAAAMDTLTKLGFTALCSTPAFSKTWLPDSQLQWFAWGGGIPGLCGQPLMSFMFDLLHTVELGWEKYVMAYGIVSVQRSRGTNGWRSRVQKLLGHGNFTKGWRVLHREILQRDYGPHGCVFKPRRNPGN